MKPRERRTHKLTIMVEPKLAALIQKRADAKRCSMAQLVRELMWLEVTIER